MKLLFNMLQVLWAIWGYVRPIYRDVLRIIKQVDKLGLENKAAREKVFQDITDCIQARGLAKVPDSVLNCTIELCYQIALWQDKKA